MDNLQLNIESLIFAAIEPITIKEIQDAIERFAKEQLSEELVDHYLLEIRAKYENDEAQVIQLVEIGDTFQFMTKEIHHPLIQAHIQLENKRKLTPSAMETLAVIAYKQPVTKPEIEQIRGVNCDYTVQKLLEKELIEIVGRAESPGKPMLYGTSSKFMNHFGLKSIKDLPQLKDVLVPVENTIGEREDIMLADYQPKPSAYDLDQQDSEE